MSPRPTSKELYARYEAFSEAFEHLRMEWTECRIEIKHCKTTLSIHGN